MKTEEQKRNHFINGEEPKKINIVGESVHTFTPTPKSVLAKTTGRDCSEYHQRNPPVFEDATISLRKKGLFWMGAFDRV